MQYSKRRKNLGGGRKKRSNRNKMRGGLFGHAEEEPSIEDIQKTLNLIKKIFNTSYTDTRPNIDSINSTLMFISNILTKIYPKYKNIDTKIRLDESVKRARQKELDVLGF